MYRELNPLFEQIVGPSYESKPVLSTVAAYIDLVLRKCQDFLEKSVVFDRQSQWPTLQQQVQQVEGQARIFFRDKIIVHVEPFISMYDAPVQSAILECRSLYDTPPDTQYSCTPALLYACHKLVSALYDSTEQFLPRGTQDSAAHHAHNALWHIKIPWEQGRIQYQIAPEYKNFERDCRQFQTTLFGSYVRLLHCHDYFNDTTSDSAWCTPLILPPKNYPLLLETPLSAHKADNGQLFAAEYFDEESLSAAARHLHMSLKEFFLAQENEIGTVVMHYGPFTLINGGNTILLHGEVFSIAKRYHSFLAELIRNEGNVVDWSSMSHEAYNGKLKWENGNKYASDLRGILMTKTGHRMIVTEKKRGWRLDIGA